MKNENAISVLFEDKTQYSNILKNFRDKARDHGLSVEEHVLYNLLRGLPAERGFTPLTNKNKLQHTPKNNPFYTLKLAKYSLGYILQGFTQIERELAMKQVNDNEALMKILTGYRNAGHFAMLFTISPDPLIRFAVIAVLKEMLK